MAQLSSSTLVFLERREQCAAYLQEMRTENSHHTAIALSPEAMEALDAANVPYTIPEDYSLEDLVDLGRKNYEDTANFCAALDRFLQQESQTIREHGLTPATYQYYELKLLRDAVSFRLHWLRKILQAEAPQEILFFATEEQPVRPDLGLIDESLYSRLIPLVAAAYSVPARMLRVSSPARELRTQPAPKGKALLRWLVGDSRYAALSAARSVRALRWWPVRRRPSNTVLLAGGGANLEPILRQIAREGSYRLVHWQGSGRPVCLHPLSLRGLRPRVDRATLTACSAECRQLWGRLAQEPWLREFFSDVSDIPVYAFPVVESRLRAFVTEMVPEMLRVHLATQQVLQHYRPSLVLTSVIYGHAQRAVLDTARRQQVPVVGYQHGGWYGYCRFPMHHYNDTALVDHFGAYGPGVREHLQRTSRPAGSGSCTVASIGSPVLEALRSRPRPDRARLMEGLGFDPERRTVMYVPTNFSGNFAYLPGTFPDTLYYRLQTQLIDLMARYSDIQFLIKLPSSSWASQPIPERIARRRLPNVKVVTRESFSEVLGTADAYIIDWPATVLLEALTTDAPIVVLADRRILPVEEEAAALLKRGVTFTQETTDFLTGVEELLARNDPQPASTGEARREFLRLYGLGETDGGSTQRALTWLEGIVSSGAAAPEGERQPSIVGERES